MAYELREVVNGNGELIYVILDVSSEEPLAEFMTRNRAEAEAKLAEMIAEGLSDA